MFVRFAELKMVSQMGLGKHGFTVCRKTRFWVAQRFQRCDKIFFSLKALAPEGHRGKVSRPPNRTFLILKSQNNELCLRVGVILKYSYASCVATRPRGVRFKNPACIRNGS